MAENTCKQCGTFLALADRICPQCGHPVDTSAQAAVLAEKAETARQEGRLAEAVAGFRRALSLDPPPELAASMLQKTGLLLEKQAGENTSSPLLQQAQEAYQKALDLNPQNEVLNQLWIANLSRRGLVEVALERYRKLKAANPEDAVAVKMLRIAQLSVEFKSNPVKVELHIDSGKKGPLQRMVAAFLTPNPYSWVTAITMLASSLGSWIFMGAGGQDIKQRISQMTGPSSPEIGTGLDAAGPLLDMATSPWIFFLSTVVSAAYLFYLIRARKK